MIQLPADQKSRDSREFLLFCISRPKSFISGEFHHIVEWYYPVYPATNLIGLNYMRYVETTDRRQAVCFMKGEMLLLGDAGGD